MAKANNDTFTLGDTEIKRLGFGAMRITGEGVWGEPEDKEKALRVLKRAAELGVNFIDTADSYGPEVSENLIREALYPYEGLTIATKGGLTRHGPNVWKPVGRPEYLRQCVLLSLRRLDVEQLELWQLHRIDSKVDREEQFGVMAEMQKEGLIKHLGLSEVSVEDIEAASEHFEVATVQNLYNLVNRKSEDVLDYCEENGIGFIPWYPLAAGDLADEGSVLDEVATRLDATPSEVALAWVLRRSEVMLPIPGTSSAEHLEENMKAAGLELSDEDFQQLDQVGKEAWEKQQEG